MDSASVHNLDAALVAASAAKENSSTAPYIKGTLSTAQRIPSAHIAPDQFQPLPGDLILAGSDMFHNDS